MRFRFSSLTGFRSHGCARSFKSLAQVILLRPLLFLALLCWSRSSLRAENAGLPVPTLEDLVGTRFEHVNIHALDQPSPSIRERELLTMGSGTIRPTPDSGTVHAGHLPRLSIREGQFRDPSGRVVFLRGVNYSTRVKWKPYYAWQTQSHFEEIRDLGFNCVRYLISWDALEPSHGQIDEAYLAHIENVIQWADEAEVYLLLDMHQDLFSPLPECPKSEREPRTFDRRDPHRKSR